MRTFDTIVIGGGVMGAATTWALAKKGHRALCLDQFGIPNAMGSSHGHTRITRMAYFEHADYVPLLRRANALWRELEVVSDAELLVRTGGLYLGPPDSPLIAGSKQSAETHGLAYEWMSREEVVRRFPAFQVPEDSIGFYEADGGVLFPERCVNNLVSAAAHLGARFHGHERVESWSASQTSVTVRTNRDVYTAASLVLCAGPWASKAIADIGVELIVTRQVAAWYWPSRPEIFQPACFPICAMQDERGSFAYAFPMFPDRPGLKAASHDLGPRVDPDGVRGEPLPEETDSFEGTLRQYLPDAAGPLLSLSACLYTNTPDGHFILDRHPDHPNVVLGCGFSGHGFKFGTVVGEALADLVVKGLTELPIGFLRADRFQA